MRCTKKIASFFKQEKSISIDEATTFFLQIIQDRISNNEYRYELYFSLNEYYYDKKQFEMAFKMINSAITSTSPYEFQYLHKLRNCYARTAQILRVSIVDEKERSSKYIFRITAACLFEVASEINFSLMDDLRFYFDYREDDFSENYYLNDDDGYLDTALKTLNLFERKPEIINDIHKFATYDIPKRMGFSEKLLAGDKKASGKGNLNSFDDAPMILDFAKSILSKSYQSAL